MCTSTSCPHFEFDAYDLVARVSEEGKRDGHTLCDCCSMPCKSSVMECEKFLDQNGSGPGDD